MSEKIYIKLSKKQRIGFLLLSVLFVLSAALMNLLYRPYIYENNIFDFHIADSNSNLFAVPAAICFWLSIEKSTVSRLMYSPLYVSAGFVLYEFIGLTYDVYDILATIISGCICFIVICFIIKEKINRDNLIIHF